jgi:hypothetical protein
VAAAGSDVACGRLAEVEHQALDVVERLMPLVEGLAINASNVDVSAAPECRDEMTADDPPAPATTTRW